MAFIAPFEVQLRPMARSVQRGISCPVDHERVTITLRVDGRTGEYLDVRACSRYADAKRMECPRSCVAVLNARRARAG